MDLESDLDPTSSVGLHIYVSFQEGFPNPDV